MYITREYYKTIKRQKAIEPSDWQRLADLSRAAGFKNYSGYSRTTFKNIVEKGYSCADDVCDFIIEYYRNKILKLQNQKVNNGN